MTRSAWRMLAFSGLFSGLQIAVALTAPAIYHHFVGSPL